MEAEENVYAEKWWAWIDLVRTGDLCSRCVCMADHFSTIKYLHFNTQTHNNAILLPGHTRTHTNMTTKHDDKYAFPKPLIFVCVLFKYKVLKPEVYHLSKVENTKGITFKYSIDNRVQLMLAVCCVQLQTFYLPLHKLSSQSPTSLPFSTTMYRRWKHKAKKAVPKRSPKAVR